MRNYDTPQILIGALTDPVALSYECKLCGRMGTAHYERDFVREADSWKHLLHCNRCADFRNRIARLRDRLKAAALVYWCEMQKPPTKRNDKLFEILDGKFIDITKEIAMVTCRHWHQQNFWEQEFVQQVKDNPGKAETIVNLYCAGVKQLATQCK